MTSSDSETRKRSTKKSFLEKTFLTRFRSHRRKPCSCFYANVVESLTEGKLDDREWILRFLNHQYLQQHHCVAKNSSTTSSHCKNILTTSSQYKNTSTASYYYCSLKKNPPHCFWPNKVSCILSFAPEKYLHWYQK